jgi:hypothetical protein
MRQSRCSAPLLSRGGQSASIRETRSPSGPSGAAVGMKRWRLARGDLVGDDTLKSVPTRQQSPVVGRRPLAHADAAVSRRLPALSSASACSPIQQSRRQLRPLLVFVRWAVEVSQIPASVRRAGCPFRGRAERATRCGGSGGARAGGCADRTNREAGRRGARRGRPRLSQRNKKLTADLAEVAHLVRSGRRLAAPWSCNARRSGTRALGRGVRRALSACHKPGLRARLGQCDGPAFVCGARWPPASRLVAIIWDWALLCCTSCFAAASWLGLSDHLVAEIGEAVADGLGVARRMGFCSVVSPNRRAPAPSTPGRRPTAARPPGSCSISARPS